MQCIINNEIYDVPGDILSRWVQMTPKLRNELDGLFESFMAKYQDRITEIGDNVDGVLAFMREVGYTQIIYEAYSRAVRDMIATMGYEDFTQLYRTGMTRDEAIELAQLEGNEIYEMPE